MLYSGPRKQKCKYRCVVTCSGLPFVAYFTYFTDAFRVTRSIKPFEGEPWRQILKLVDKKINVTFNS
jgi:hypothetical protein